MYADLRNNSRILRQNRPKLRGFKTKNSSEPLSQPLISGQFRKKPRIWYKTTPKLRENEAKIPKFVCQERTLQGFTGEFDIY